MAAKQTRKEVINTGLLTKHKNVPQSYADAVENSFLIIMK